MITIKYIYIYIYIELKGLSNKLKNLYLFFRSTDKRHACEVFSRCPYLTETPPKNFIEAVLLGIPSRQNS